MALDTHMLIIGAGMSGICTAIQMIRQHKSRNFVIIEKSTELGGTWAANTYPGCGCDVPSHFYSYSFALKPDWSQKFAMQPEILSYFEEVADSYDIKNHIRFESTVESAHWDVNSASWIVKIHHDASNDVLSLRAKILVSAVGSLSIPKQCGIPGASNFTGRIFHTAKWDHSFDWEGKTVVVVGNGCSATQLVPAISEGPRAARKVIQFGNQAHWLAERPNPKYSSSFKWAMQWIPLAMRLYRAFIYGAKERGFRSYDIESGAKYRAKDQKAATEYIRKHAPAEYCDFLVPKIEIGCKRMVNDTEYLASLHRENVELMHRDPIEHIESIGVRTRSGRLIEADAIILATGFETQKVLAPMKIYGEKGLSVNDHWQKVSDGIPSAYLGTCLEGFPNFFVMMGPNTLSGHLSVIFTTECQVNAVIQLIRPIIKTLHGKATRAAQVISVKPEAERRDLLLTQTKARRLVWATGCSSWFLDPVTGRNSIMFPDYQFKFWLRSSWISWDDFIYE
ncbi:hypothetical protein F5B20DRAFT_546324 [Whalleya microplaca]|nr:hypothetical protein F5B20DRAFT_546324 [Whalleya microplaca]